jgi:hypothetical protein
MDETAWTYWLTCSRGKREDGTLCDSIGTGEYLDKSAIASARRRVSSQAVNLRYLPVVKLVLAGFVVDAGPFFRWFNPLKLRSVDFSYGCVDAGFALPFHMSELVTVSWPGNLPQKKKTITVSKVSQHHIKSICLKRASSKASRSERGLKPRISSMMNKPWLSATRTHSLNGRWNDAGEHQQHKRQATRSRWSSISKKGHNGSKPVS